MKTVAAEWRLQATDGALKLAEQQVVVGSKEINLADGEEVKYVPTLTTVTAGAETWNPLMMTGNTSETDRLCNVRSGLSMKRSVGWLSVKEIVAVDVPPLNDMEPGDTEAGPSMEYCPLTCGVQLTTGCMFTWTLTGPTWAFATEYVPNVTA